MYGPVYITKGGLAEKKCLASTVSEQRNYDGNSIASHSGGLMSYSILYSIESSLTCPVMPLGIRYRHRPAR